MTTSDEIALLVAVKYNLKETCLRLLGRGVNVNAKDSTMEPSDEAVVLVFYGRALIGVLK